MKTGIAAALILLGVSSGAFAQRTPVLPSDRTVPAAPGTPEDAEAANGRPRVAPSWNDRTNREETPAQPRSPYGNGVRTPWQDNPIRTPWQ
jgi:hypothetical protein